MPTPERCRPSFHAAGVRLATLLLGVVIVGCGGGTDGPSASPAPPTAPPAPPAPPTVPVGLTLSTRVYDDTIQAAVPTPLAVTVGDGAGRPVVGDTVYFSTTTLPPFTPAVLLAPAPAGRLESSIGVPTDSAGVARAVVQLNFQTGSGFIQVRVPRLGLRDSVAVAVRPGAPARLEVSGARDVALGVGAEMAYGARVLDRFGTALPATLEWTSRRPDVVSVESGSGRARTVGVGRAWLVATAGRASDSVAMSVVPRGSLVAMGSGPALYFFDLDGSNYRRVNAEPGAGATYSPSWTPTGSHVVYQSDALAPDGEFRMRLARADVERGVASVLAIAPPVGDEGHVLPQLTLDGQWLYYTFVRGYQRTELWRARPDGTGATRVGPVATQVGHMDTWPSPSPDGARLVYYNSGELRILTLSSAQSVATGLRGTSPRWSPTRSEIAYFASAGLAVASLDGGAPRVLWPGDGVPAPGRVVNAQGLWLDTFSWSPDGNWLVLSVSTYDSAMLVLASRATGELLPLPYTARDHLRGAAWRPDR